MYEYMENISDVFINNQRVDTFNELYRQGWRVVGVFCLDRRVTTMLERRVEDADRTVEAGQC